VSYDGGSLSLLSGALQLMAANQSVGMPSECRKDRQFRVWLRLNMALPTARTQPYMPEIAGSRNQSYLTKIRFVRITERAAPVRGSDHVAFSELLKAALNIQILFAVSIGR
jgi:hypothetical protein